MPIECVRLGSAIGVIMTVLLPSLVQAQHHVRAWPNPGYGRLGVYAGGPRGYFDYELIKLSLGDTLPNKKAYWAGLHVAPRGAEPKRQAATQGLHRGPLQVEVPPGELGDLQEFDVHVLLRSTSGVEHGTKACATLRALKVEGR